MRDVIKCQASSEGESWSIEIFDGEALLASVRGLSNAAHAREAADYLRLGVLSNWRISCNPSAEEVSAAAEAAHEFDLEEAQRDVPAEDDCGDSPDQIERRRVREILRAAIDARASRISALTRE
ncbi:hypothetical protein [Burkholderia ambifaria]|uniref:hypothetical protein n=1 Tax=Burkholderia ambifaria TaxID=152480 RepID=UPI001B95F6C7|nr:hypothetical protein [Burkholderia ambifaria]MBR8221291.1 hypothetical protein [Burkholderia ambifaria]